MPMIIYFYVHVAQYFRTGYSIFFPLDIERDWRKKKKNQKFKLNTLSVLAT